MLEIRAGVFVGSVTAAVRDQLWFLTCQQLKGGAGTLVYPDKNEQGFSFKLWGDPDRWVVDLEGLKVVQYRSEE